MSNVIKKIKQIAYLFRHKSSDLRVKMMLYFVAIALTTIGFLVVILAWSGRIFNLRAQMASVMTNHLNNQVEKATEEITQYTAYGIELSRSISKTIDDVLEEYNIEFYQINNNPEVLETIQNRISIPLSGWEEAAELMPLWIPQSTRRFRTRLIRKRVCI